MKLYHGTSTKFLKSILKNGITPRIINENDNWTHSPVKSSRKEYVYLTSLWGFGLFFGDNSCGGSKTALPVILEVEVDKENLEQDDDMKAIGEKFVKGFNTDAKGSLKILGTVAHRGTIEPNQITRIYIIRDMIYMLNFEKDGFNQFAVRIEQGMPKVSKAKRWIRRKLIKLEGILSYSKPNQIEYQKFTPKKVLNKELSDKYRKMAYPELFNKKTGEVKK